jgi:hypothetical protein
MMFDFLGMPPWKYYSDYVYKKRMINTKYIIEIEQCKPKDDSELYEN